MGGFVIENGVLTRYLGPGGDEVLPETVREIGPDAFNEFHHWDDGLQGRPDLLTSVAIPGGVTRIGKYAFFGCTRLKQAPFPPALRELGEMAFYDCRLEEIHLPDGVAEIPRECFYWNLAARSVCLPQDLRHIGYRAFYGCRAMTRLTIPPQVTAIEAEAFERCDGLRWIENLSTVNILRESVLGDELPRDLDGFFPHEDLSRLSTAGQRIAVGAFLRHQERYDEADRDRYRRFLKKHQEEFLECYCEAEDHERIALLLETKLVELPTLEAAMEKWAERPAVMVRLMLYRRTLPEQTLELEPELLEAAVIPPASALWSRRTNEDETLTLTSYKGSEETVLVPERIGKRAAAVLGAGACSPDTPRCPNAQWRREGLRRVIVPEGITRLEDRVFRGCEALERVELPQSLTHIASHVFSGCTALRELTIPPGVSMLDFGVFEGCRLDRLTVQGAQTRLHYNCRYYNGAIAAIHAPAGSPAEAYARKNQIPFEAIEGETV